MLYNNIIIFYSIADPPYFQFLGHLEPPCALVVTNCSLAGACDTGYFLSFERVGRTGDQNRMHCSIVSVFKLEKVCFPIRYIFT